MSQEESKAKPSETTEAKTKTTNRKRKADEMESEGGPAREPRRSARERKPIKAQPLSSSSRTEISIESLF